LWAYFILGGKRVSFVVVVVLVAHEIFRVVEIDNEANFFTEIIVEARLSFFEYPLDSPAEIIGDGEERLARGTLHIEDDFAL